MALIYVGAAVVAFSASDSTSNARGFLDEITHAKDSNSSICDNTVVQHSGYFKLTTGKLPKNYFCKPRHSLPPAAALRGRV